MSDAEKKAAARRKATQTRLRSVELAGVARVAGDALLPSAPEAEAAEGGVAAEVMRALNGPAPAVPPFSLPAFEALCRTVRAVEGRLAALDADLQIVKMTYKQKRSPAGQRPVELLCVHTNLHGAPCRAYRQHGSTRCNKHMMVMQNMGPILQAQRDGTLARIMEVMDRDASSAEPYSITH